MLRVISMATVTLVSAWTGVSAAGPSGMLGQRGFLVQDYENVQDCSVSLLLPQMNASFPRGSRRWHLPQAGAVYALVTLLLLTVDVLYWSQVQPGALTVLVTFGAAGAGLLLGRFPFLAGCVVILASIIDTICAAHLGAMTLVIVLPLIDWIVRRWWWSAAIGMSVNTGASLVMASDRVGAVSLLLLLYLLVVSVGGGMGAYRSQVHAATLRSQVLEARLSEQESRIRARLSLLLHDSLATDLAQTIVYANLLVQESQDEQVRERAQTVLNSAESGMRQLRALMQGLWEHNRALEVVSTSQGLCDVPAVLEASRQMLGRRCITLQGGLGEDDVVLGRIDNAQTELLGLTLQEACLNAFKYAPPRSVVNLEAGVQGGMLSLEVASDLSESDTSGRRSGAGLVGLQGGLGLVGLSLRAERLGGRVIAGPVGTRWLLSLSLPLDRTGG